MLASSRILYLTLLLITYKSNAYISRARARQRGGARYATKDDTHQQILGQHVRPIRMPGEDSFVEAMTVPTFAMSEGEVNFASSLEPKYRGLEGALDRGPAFMLDNVMNPEACQEMINACEALGFKDYNVGKNNHGALQLLVSDELVRQLEGKLGRFIDLHAVEERRRESEGYREDEEVRLVYQGLNRRWRVYRYNSDSVESFAPHIDAGFPPSGLDEDQDELIWDTSNGTIVSRLTILLYLNNNFKGGETKFYEPQASAQGEYRVIAAVRPKQGSCLVFPQGVGDDAVEYARKYWPLHEGSAVESGSPKYVIRSDVMFTTIREDLPLHDKYMRYDHLVRETFLPKSPLYDKRLLSQAESLYNPQMGVENMGPFLYSFVRLTKVRKIVEIGAGYTSLWILQALRDNVEEMKRIRELQDSGRLKMLDYPWTVGSFVDSFGEEEASLLCIDNCAHQKETATGISPVARGLGLSKYLKFVQGDAYQMEFEKDSVDVLWADFGVGSRLREFVGQAWTCVRPGGFLLVHSSITNLRSREWLDAVRERKGEEVTGLPVGSYVELSLLEPHKRFQNSITVLQKRSGYEESVYSEYA